jgi:uncharacterized protein YgiM (DUF1202 family)
MFSTGVIADSTIVYVGGDVEIPVRANASSSEDNIITSIALNEPVTLLQTVDGWSNIKYDGWQGWMVSSYLSKSKPDSESTQQVKSLRKTIDSVQNTNLNLTKQLMEQSKRYEEFFYRFDFQDTQLVTKEVELNMLRHEVQALTFGNTTLLEQITTNKNSYTFYVALSGVIALFLGIMIGLFGGNPTLLSKICKEPEQPMKSS